MRLYFVLFFLLHSMTWALGQGISPIVDLKLEPTAISNYVGIDGQTYYSDTTVFNVVLKLSVSDTTIISKLNIELFKDKSGAVFFQKTFDYDVFGAFMDGTSYSRNGFDITLNLGDYSGFIEPKISLVIQRVDSTSTDPIVYF